MPAHVLTSQAEIAEAAKKFRSILEAASTEHRERKIGFQGGAMTAVVHWLPAADLWVAFADVEANRFWNAFGLGNPSDSEMLSIVVEVNPPFEGRDRRCAGAFIRKDNGEVWLGHSGKIGGGKRGVGKSEFLKAYEGQRIAVEEGDSFIALGRVDSDELPEQIALFVRAVRAFKSSASTENGRAEETVRLFPKEPGSVWIEITTNDDYHGGPGWEFGRCLWSPAENASGNDSYALMREPMPGDLVLHFLKRRPDENRLVGRSFVREKFQEIRTRPPNPGAWDGRKSYYRIELRDYVSIEPPLPVPELLRQHGESIKKELEQDRPKHYPFTFYRDDLRTVQGIYVARCTPNLYGLIVRSCDQLQSRARSQEPAHVTPDELGPRTQLDPASIKLGALLLPSGLVERCCAALNAGSHVLLVGPPGTGKSSLASLIADHAAERLGLRDPITATASADWTTYDTIGGWTQRQDQTLAFREGVVTRALREKRWLVLDEVNRADIDKCFGELFTVLAGGTATTAYTDQDGQAIQIGPEARPYTFGSWFRLIATMNARDKSSLFRLSYAFLRRFAVIYVPVLDDAALSQLAATYCAGHEISAEIGQRAVVALSRENGLGRFVPIGPSMLLDVLSYAKARGAEPAKSIGEGVAQFVFAQLDGLSDATAQRVDSAIEQLFKDDPSVVRQLQHEFRLNYPHLFHD
jgi:hypothetical protein